MSLMEQTAGRRDSWISGAELWGLYENCIIAEWNVAFRAHHWRRHERTVVENLSISVASVKKITQQLCSAKIVDLVTVAKTFEKQPRILCIHFTRQVGEPLVADEESYSYRAVAFNRCMTGSSLFATMDLWTAWGYY